MKPKCAWIDQCLDLNILSAMELRQREIQLDARGTLEAFERDFNLNSYQVLLYHPGREQQKRLKEVVEKYPNTKVALITAPSSGNDYKEIKSDMPILTDDADSVEQFILENQFI